MNFEFFYKQLKAGMNINETCFYFDDEPQIEERYIGYSPEYEKPYWVGYCDIEDGCEFYTAEDLVNAKIYKGKSLIERWENVVIESIEGLSLDDWFEFFEHC